MGLALLWIGSLAASLLFMATAVAFRAQTSRGWLGREVMALSILLPLVVGAGEVFASGYLLAGGYRNHWLAYTASWLILLLLGGAWVLRRGFKRTNGRWTASTWPLTHLAAGAFTALSLYAITAWSTDRITQLQLANMRTESSGIIMATATSCPPDRENAALLYEKAFTALKRPNDQERKWRSVLSRNSHRWWRGFDATGYPVNDPELLEYLEHRQPTVKLLIRSAAMPGCYFRRDYAQLAIHTAPESQIMGECVCLLAADAQCKAAKGDVRAALENVAAIRGMAAQTGSAALLIPGAVGVNLETTGARALEGVLARGKPTEEDLSVLAPVDRLSWRRVQQRCMTGEEAFGLTAFSMTGEYPFGNSSLLNGSLGWLYRTYLLQSDLVGYREVVKAMRDETELSFKEAQAKARQREATLQNCRPGIFSSGWLPCIERAHPVFTRGEAVRRLADLAVVVARYRARKGTLPEKATDLVPEFTQGIPEDPFDGQPLRFVRAQDAVLMYSVGENLTDEGGKVRDDKTGNVVFRVGDTGQ